MTGYTIVVVQPPGYAHSAAFLEVAESLLFALRRLGQDVSIATAPVAGRRSIVLGSNLLPGHPLALEQDAILYNLEQIEPGSSWLSPAFLDLLRRYQVWDYSARNAARYPEMGLRAPRVVPVGFVPELTRIAPREEDIDVLFYGSMNERRQRVLDGLAAAGLRVHTAFGVYGEPRDQLIARAKVVLNVHYYEAKVFEVVRVSYLLANGRCVVSERGGDPAEEREFEKGVAFSAYGDLVETCLRLCRDEAARRGLAEEGKRAFCRRDLRVPLAAALGIPGTAESRPAAPPAAGTGGDPVVSIVIPAFNKWEYTFRCLLSIANHTRDVPHETIVVDNASTDETRVALPLLKGVRVQRNAENLGFARASNQGAAMARGRYVLFLNNDTEALPGWLPPMVKILESEPDVGIVGAKLLFPDGTLQHAGVGVGYASPRPISPFHLQYREPASASQERLDLPAVTAACMLIRRELCQELGGFDEAFVNGNEDVDLCFRARERGFRVAYTPETVLYHHESITPGRFAKVAHNQILLHERWLDRFQEFTHGVPPRLELGPARGTGRNLSVVVPVLDALDVVAVCAEAVLPGLRRGDELVLADGGSSDSTLRYARKLSRDHGDCVRVVEGRGLHGALVAALESARAANAVVIPAFVRLDQGALDNIAIRITAADRRFLLQETGRAGLIAAGPILPLREAAASEPAAFFEEREAKLRGLLESRSPPTAGGAGVAPAEPIPLGKSEAATPTPTAPRAAPPRGGAFDVSRARARRPLTVALFTLDAPETACYQLRLGRPLEVLADAVRVRPGVLRDGAQLRLDGAAVQGADLIVIQRVFPSAQLTPVVDTLLGLGLPVVYELDDLLHDLPDTNPHKAGLAASSQSILDLVRRATAVTVSTEALKARLAGFGSRIHVFPNLLDERLWGSEPAPRPERDGPVVIGYAGTGTHLADLQLVEEALVKLSAKWGDRVAFRFMGCATERLAALPGFSFLRFEMGYEAYARALPGAGIDVGVIPLVDNPFNRCKSDIKWLEYSACGIASVCSDLPPYSSVRSGETGLRVRNTPEDWFAALDRLVADARARRSMAERARAQVMAQRTMKARARDLLEIYRTTLPENEAGPTAGPLFGCTSAHRAAPAPDVR